MTAAQGEAAPVTWATVPFSPWPAHGPEPHGEQRALNGLSFHNSFHNVATKYTFLIASTKYYYGQLWNQLE